MNKKTKTQKEHYVNNKEFLNAMIDYKKQSKKKRRKNKDPCYDYIGSFLKMRITYHIDLILLIIHLETI